MKINFDKIDWVKAKRVTEFILIIVAHVYAFYNLTDFVIICMGLYVASSLSK